MLLNGLNWENNAFFDSFFNFSPREQKKCSFSADVFWIPPTFSPLTPLHYSRFGSLRLPRGLLRPPLGHPRGDPGLRSGLHSPRSRLHDPSLLSFRFVRSEKSFGIQKSLWERAFFLFSRRKKKESKNAYYSHWHIWIHKWKFVFVLNTSLFFFLFVYFCSNLEKVQTKRHRKNKLVLIIHIKAPNSLVVCAWSHRSSLS